VTHRRRERVWGLRGRSAQDEADVLQRAVSWRRWIYRHNLYAKVTFRYTICSVILIVVGILPQHVASNKYTRYRPYPTPSQFAASQDFISRMTIFLRRELLVWPNADVEVCTCILYCCSRSRLSSTHPNYVTSNHGSSW